MSALFGVFNRDGGPVQTEQLTAMSSALVELGTHDHVQRCDGGFGVGCRWWDDVPGTGGTDASWHRDAESGLVAVAEGWLTDRHDIARSLGLNAHVPLAELLSACWRQSPERCLADLTGELNLIVWHPHDRRLTMVSSPTNSPALYWCETPRFVAFASRARALACVPGFRLEVDLRRLAGAAVPRVAQLRTQATIFAGVQRVRSGMVGAFDPGRSSWNRWWMSDSAHQPAVSPAEIADALRDRLTTVLRSRTEGTRPVAGLLSGGLDSSAVVAYAHEACADRLVVLSAVHPTPSGPDSDERPYIGAVRRHLSLHGVDVTADGRGPFDDIARLVRTAESPLTTSRHYLYTAFAECAAARGARLLLDGVGGERGVSHDGVDGLFEQLQAGKVWRVLHEVLRYRSVQQISIAHALSQLLLRPKWRRPYGPAVARGQATTLFRHSFLRSQGIDVTDMARSVARSTAEGGNHRGRLARALQFAQEHHHYFCGSDGLTVSCPLGDRRLLELCLAVPPSAKFRDGYPRALVRDLLTDKVPDVVRWRTSKQAFSPDYSERFFRQLPEVETALAAIPLADPVRDIVDVPRLQAMAKRIKTASPDGARERFAALHTLPNGVYLIAFLRHFL